MPDPDFFNLFTALEEHHVQYVVIGGIALMINGGSVMTSDIDLCISFDRENLVALAEALNQFEPALRTGIKVRLDEQAFGGEFVTYFTSVGVIQVINRINGFANFAELASESNVLEVRGLPVRVASLKALERMKSGTGRERDKIHLDIIQSLRKRVDH